MMKRLLCALALSAGVSRLCGADAVLNGVNIFLKSNSIPQLGFGTAKGDGGAITNLHGTNMSDAITLSFPGPRQALTTNGSTVTVSNTMGWVTPFDYGAKGGTTDDTVAFSNALNSGYAVYVPNWTNYTVANLFASNAMTLEGDGSKITFKAGSTGYLFDFATATNVHLRHLFLDGGSPPDTNVLYWQPSQGTRSGVRAFVFSANSEIFDVTCNNFTDAGFRFGSGTGTDPKQIGPVTTSQAMRQSPMRFSKNEARGNFLGIHIAGYDANNVQEYLEIGGCTARNDYYGIEIDSGNIQVTGGMFTGNNYGAYILNGGPNNAHGEFNGTILNHNNVSVFCDGIALGFSFNGCKILGGLNYIWLRNATGVAFQGCQMDLDYGINDGGGTNYCRYNYWTVNDPARVWTNANSGKMIFTANDQVLGTTNTLVSHYLSSSNRFFGRGVFSGNVEALAVLTVTGITTNKSDVWTEGSAFVEGSLFATDLTAQNSFTSLGGSNYLSGALRADGNLSSGGAAYFTNGYYMATNGNNSGVVPVGKTTITNITGDITIAGFSGIDDGSWNSALLVVTNSAAATHTVTFAGTVKSPDGSGPVYYVTNGIEREFGIGIRKGRTNVTSAPFY